MKRVPNFQKGENGGSRVVRPNNSRGGNVRGMDKRRLVGKSSVYHFNCQKLGHFAREFNYNKKEPQEDEVRVAMKEFDDEKTLLVMIIEGECNNNSLKNATEPYYNRSRNVVIGYMLNKMQR